jgi:hypothetical protein
LGQACQTGLEQVVADGRVASWLAAIRGDEGLAVGMNFSRAQGGRRVEEWDPWESIRRNAMPALGREGSVGRAPRRFVHRRHDGNGLGR